MICSNFTVKNLNKRLPRDWHTTLHTLISLVDSSILPLCFWPFYRGVKNKGVIGWIVPFQFNGLAFPVMSRFAWERLLSPSGKLFYLTRNFATLGNWSYFTIRTGPYLNSFFLTLCIYTCFFLYIKWEQVDYNKWNIIDFYEVNPSKEKSEYKPEFNRENSLFFQNRQFYIIFKRIPLILVIPTCVKWSPRCIIIWT